MRMLRFASLPGGHFWFISSMRFRVKVSEEPRAGFPQTRFAPQFVEPQQQICLVVRYLSHDFTASAFFWI